MDTKNNSLAENYREIGNQHFHNQEYFDALIFYNRSLCTAEKGSESIPIAFANRSAVYLKLNLFDLCLENIKLAREHNYPSEKIERIDNREKECKELMEKKLNPNPYDDPFNFFKLSYPPNPKYPQMVDCLELHKDLQGGVHVITSRDLKTGDIIAIENPTITSFNPGARLYRCSFCLKDQLMNLLPCTGCALAMFCSEKCRQRALRGFHKYDCKSDEKSTVGIDFPVQVLVHCLSVFDYNIDELQNFLDNELNHFIKKKLFTVFDFDFSNPEDPMYEKNMILVIVSQLLGHNHKFEQLRMSSLLNVTGFAAKNSKFGQFFRKDTPSLATLNYKYTGICNGFGLTVNPYFSKNINLIEKEIDIFLKSQGTDENRPGIVSENIGMTIYPLIKLLNHSCDPNVMRLEVSGKMVTYVCKPIKKGTEIFRSLNNFAKCGPAYQRNQSLASVYGFTCSCEACKKNWPKIEGMRSADKRFNHAAVRIFSSHEHAKLNIDRNNAYVDKHYKEHKPPTKEVYFTIDNNFLELAALTRPTFYP